MSYRNIHQTDRPAVQDSRERVAQKKEEAANRRKELLATTGLQDRGQSEHDLRAAARGTNASEVSRDFSRAFGKDAEGNPTDNKPLAWRQQFEPGMTARQPVAGTPASGATKQAGGKVAPATPSAPPSTSSASLTPASATAPSASAPSVAPEVSPTPPLRNAVPTWDGLGSNLQSPRIQRMLDANVNPRAPLKIAQAMQTPGSAVKTRYGQMAVSNGAGEAKNADGTPAAKAVTTANGVYRDTANAWQQQVMGKYPQIGQANSPANKAFVEAWKQARAQQSPKANGAAGADPMKIAENVTQDLTRQAQEAKVAREAKEAMDAKEAKAKADVSIEHQTRNFLNPSARIPMFAKGQDIGQGIQIPHAAARAAMPMGDAGLSINPATPATPPMQLGDMMIGHSQPAANPAIGLGKASIGEPSHYSPASAPSVGSQLSAPPLAMSPSSFMSQGTSGAGLPTMPKLPSGPTNFLNAPTLNVDVSPPPALSGNEMLRADGWNGFGGLGRPEKKDKPEAEKTTPFTVTNPSGLNRP